MDDITVTLVTPAPIIVQLSGGTQGPAGPPGGSFTYAFAQASPLSVWTVSHNLNRFPSVTVVDSTDREVEGDVYYVDANNVTITFSAPFSGVAYLN